MVTRLSGGLTPANGADPRTFPAIWNATAVDIEAAQADVTVLQSDVDIVEGSAVALGSAVTVLQGSAVALGSAVDVIEAWDLDDLNDVTIGTAVANGQVLAYSTAVSGWVNEDVAGGGKILQVVNSTYDTVVTTTSTTFVTSGLSASITPSSASNKILILAYTNGQNASTAARGRYTIFRGTVSDTNLSSAGTMGTVYNSGAGGSESTVHLNFLDTPATTASVTYTLGLRSTSVAGSVSAQFSSTISSMTLMEVAG